jgi:PA14 domain/Ricin-type beta-trefoil lectin domain-like/Secretion system C-terminal sorting domain
LNGTPVVQRVEPTIDSDWGLGTPNVAGIGADNFSIRWESILEVPVTGTYTFTSITDDGVRLWVNNQLIINKWIAQAPTPWTGTIALTAGQKVPIKMEYYEAGGGAVARLRWSYAGVGAQAIPQNRLCATTLIGVNGFVATNCYRFMARHSGKVMEIENSITANGANVKQNGWNGGKNQIWRIKPVGGDYYQIVNGNSGRVLDVAGISLAAGANLVQWDWVNGGNQKWKFTRNAAGFYVVAAQHSGQVIDVYAASVANNVQMTQYPVHNGNNQQFQISEVGCPVGTAAYQSANILAAQGFKDGRKGVISWLTNANAQQDYYVVEKLGYDPTFEKLEYVNARPAAAGEPLYYSVTDAQPSEGLNTYRVALYRNGDPNPQYSELIHLDFSYLADYFVYPNPAYDVLHVDLEAVEYRSVQLQITDLTGKILQEVNLDVAPKTTELSLEKLGVGSYLLRIQAENRREVTKKFTILR